jgi:hypothetical protein
LSASEDERRPEFGNRHPRAAGQEIGAMMYPDPFNPIPQEHDRYRSREPSYREERSYWALAVFAVLAGVLVIAVAMA